MGYPNYWKCDIMIPEKLQEKCKAVLDNKALLLGDALYIFTLDETTLPYIKENYSNINGIHVVPFKLELLDDSLFYLRLEELVDWIIYDDENKKFIDNLFVIVPTSLYEEAYRICNKKVYITKWDKRWPEGQYVAFEGNITKLSGTFGLDSHYYYWINFNIDISYETTQYTTVPGDHSKDTSFTYDDDFYVTSNAINLSKYGIELPPDDTGSSSSSLSSGSDAAPKPVLYWKVIAVKTLTFIMNEKFSNTIGSLTTGVALGTIGIDILYKARPDLINE